MLFEVGLIGVQHAIKPWQELLGAVVGVEDDWDAVDGGNRADEVSGGDSTSNRGLLVLVGDALSGEVCCTSL